MCAVTHAAVFVPDVAFATEGLHHPPVALFFLALVNAWDCVSSRVSAAPLWCVLSGA